MVRGVTAAKRKQQSIGQETGIGPFRVNYMPPAVRERKRAVVDREIERIYHTHGETIRVEDVLDDARSAESPLHIYFDWNDSVAGEKWRHMQALHLIMQSKIVAQVIENNEPKRIEASASEQTSVRRLVSCFKGEGFRMRPEALSDEEMRLAMVNKKLAVLRSWLDSTIDLVELAAIRKAIAVALQKK